MKSPSDFDSLTALLKCVADVVQSEMQTALEIERVQDQYHMLELYDINIADKTEIPRAKRLTEAWKLLKVDAMTRDLRTKDVKTKFKEQTVVDVQVFAKKVKKMREQFEHRGPTVAGVTMEEGLEMMNQYQIDLGECKRRQAELVTAQQLFGLDLTTYPDLIFMEQQIELVNPIYGLYREQKEYEAEMSGKSWADLEVSTLNKGIDNIITKYKKIPKRCSGPCDAQPPAAAALRRAQYTPRPLASIAHPVCLPCSSARLPTG